MPNYRVHFISDMEVEAKDWDDAWDKGNDLIKEGKVKWGAGEAEVDDVQTVSD